jgi:hypothetical protein
MSEILKLGNIPVYNLLNEFFRWDKEIRTEEFKQQFAIGRRQPIRTQLLIWGGMPSDLMTLILQRVILGLESYVMAAVWIELGRLGRLTPELSTLVRNPFSISPRQRGTAACYYNALPGIIAPEHALERADNPVWLDMKSFYTNVRNKLLHGYQLGSHDPAVLYEPFDMIRNTYAWVNTWHTLEVRDARPLKLQITFKSGRTRD